MPVIITQAPARAVCRYLSDLSDFGKEEICLDLDIGLGLNYANKGIIYINTSIQDDRDYRIMRKLLNKRRNNKSVRSNPELLFKEEV